MYLCFTDSSNLEPVQRDVSWHGLHGCALGSRPTVYLLVYIRYTLWYAAENGTIHQDLHTTGKSTCNGTHEAEAALTLMSIFREVLVTSRPDSIVGSLVACG